MYSSEFITLSIDDVFTEREINEDQIAKHMYDRTVNASRGKKNRVDES